MNPTNFNSFCASIPQTTHVVQWGGADVWKIGGKVFAIYWSEHSGVTFKAGDIGYEVLREAQGYRPAPYFASRGMKWILADRSVDDNELRAHIQNSYELVLQGQSKKIRAAIEEACGRL